MIMPMPVSFQMKNYDENTPLYAFLQMKRKKKKKNYNAAFTIRS